MSTALPKLSTAIIRATGDVIAALPGDRRACILNYHRILSTGDVYLGSEPDLAAFRWQMQLLAECFNVLPLHEVVTRLAAGTLPARAVAITFDDGYRSIHDLALPVLQEFHLPATVFVTTGHMPDAGSMWNDRILEAMRRLPPTPLDLSELGLGMFQMDGPATRVETAHRLTEQLKYLSLAERECVIAYLQGLVGTTLRQDLMLTNTMLRTLSANAVEIGGHTVNHPILTRVDDAAARSEIVENKTQLEAITGKPVRLFAYPNGKQIVDYDQRHVQMVADAGYAAAFTTRGAAARRTDARFELPRARPWDSTPGRFAGRLLRWLGGWQR